jgi:replicative DNA helicase
MRAEGRVGVILLALGTGVLAGCRDEKPPAKNLGDQTADIVADTALIRKTQAAVNEVVRNAADCPAARATLDEARARLSEAATQVKTVAGRSTLETQEKQLSRVEQLCP